MLIIKLGGSLITYKKDDISPPFLENELGLTYRIREHVIRQVARTLRECSDEDLIIVHGGGTHGHRTVNRWRRGVARGPESLMVWEVKWRMDQLTSAVVRVLGEERVPAVSHPTSSFVLSDGSAVASMDVNSLKNIVSGGCVPVIRGDLCPDVRGGWSVVSGDELIYELCRRSGTEMGIISKVIMLMDAEGVMNRETGKVIEEIDNEHPEGLYGGGGSSPSPVEGDVSGGIGGKVKTCVGISGMGIETYITGGDAGRNLRRILEGKRAGTRFPPKGKTNHGDQGD